MKATFNMQHQQQGAALVVGLIVLLIMTLLGISSMSEPNSMVLAKLSRNIGFAG